MMRRLSYSNVVGTLALFIALGGVSWAASAPRNSVGTAQLRNGAVNSAKVKDKTITGADFKKQTITGKKIKLSSLGTVPSAAKALAADSIASEAPPLVKRVGPSSSNADFNTALASATDVPLLSSGAASLVGKCFRVGADIRSVVLARTSADGTISLPSAGIFLYGFPFLNAGQSDQTAIVAAGSASANSVATLAGGPPFLGMGIAITPDRHGIAYQANGLIKNGTVAGGNGPYGAGDRCVYAITGRTF